MTRIRPGRGPMLHWLEKSCTDQPVKAFGMLFTSKSKHHEHRRIILNAAQGFIMDYRDLLKKYMKHVIEEESIDYLSSGKLSSKYFTEEEVQALQEISNEIDVH